MNSAFKNLTFVILPACMLAFAACKQSANKTTTPTTTMTDTTNQTGLPPAKGFEKTIDGKQTHYYVLKNKNGMQISLTNYGAHLVGVLVPDKTGKLTDVAVGFDDIDGYKKSMSNYYGATIGRYGNR